MQNETKKDNDVSRQRSVLTSPYCAYGMAILLAITGACREGCHNAIYDESKARIVELEGQVSDKDEEIKKLNKQIQELAQKLQVLNQKMVNSKSDYDFELKRQAKQLQVALRPNAFGKINVAHLEFLLYEIFNQVFVLDPQSPDFYDDIHKLSKIIREAKASL